MAEMSGDGLLLLPLGPWSEHASSWRGRSQKFSSDSSAGAGSSRNSSAVSVSFFAQFEEKDHSPHLFHSDDDIMAPAAELREGLRLLEALHVINRDVMAVVAHRRLARVADRETCEWIHAANPQ